MRAPLALGILAWDEALAGFSASGVCAWVLRRGSAWGSVKMSLQKPSQNAPQGRKYKGDSGD